MLFVIGMTVTATVLLVLLRGFFIRHPILTARKTLRALRRGGRRPLMALLLAMAGTLGVGNLTGVALGIMVGGAGSVLWIAVASVLACVLKYAEGVLATDMRSPEGGGMMWVVRRVLPFGRYVAAGYAAVCLLVARSMGAILQSRAVAEAAEAAYGFETLPVAVGLAVLLCTVIVGGISRIERAVAVTVPLAAGCYILLCAAALVMNAHALPSALARIVCEAFSAQGVTGGVLGFLTSRALREGFSGGLLSNEAGAGTSALAHARSDAADAVDEGLLGMCEVAVDTLLCLLTGLCLVTCGGEVPSVGMRSPMGWLSRTLTDTLGAWCGGVLFFCVFAFAFSTVICWYYYGQSCLGYLSGKRWFLPYAAVFTLAVTLGGVLPSHVAVLLTDVGLYILFAITQGALLCASDRLRDLHRAAFFPKRRRSPQIRQK